MLPECLERERESLASSKTVRKQNLSYLKHPLCEKVHWKIEWTSLVSVCVACEGFRPWLLSSHTSILCIKRSKTPLTWQVAWTVFIATTCFHTQRFSCCDTEFCLVPDSWLWIQLFSCEHNEVLLFPPNQGKTGFTFFEAFYLPTTGFESLTSPPQPKSHNHKATWFQSCFWRWWWCELF